MIRKLKQSTDGSIHCIANGEFCIYERGADLIQVFGPPFSCGNICSAALKDKGIFCESERIKGTNTWVHKLFRGRKNIGRFTDFMATDMNVFVRVAELCEEAEIGIMRTAEAKQNGNLLCLPKGSAIYMNYPSDKDTYIYFASDGAEITDNACMFPKGKSCLYIGAGTKSEQAESAVMQVRKIGVDAVRSENEKVWRVFTSGIRVPVISEPLFTEISALAESVAVLIKAQQSREGSVIAGYNYHLGYVRDQYGVFRCLMKLGLYEEAKRILVFYRDIFEKYGNLHNAQAIGVQGVFHEHENDCSEITGYLILQATEYYEKTGDAEFFASMIPIVVQCLKWQTSCLYKNMLPFNGDETYIVGGFLSRFVIDEGSAEATLLFITSADKLFAVAPRFSLDLSEYFKPVADAAAAFKRNFVFNGRLACNNPTRREGLEFPAVRHGVCVGCNSFGNLILNDGGYDVCEKCKDRIFEYTEQRYFLPSVGLAPVYLKADIFTREELLSFVSEFTENAKNHGNNRVGYEYGYLLYALIELNADKNAIYDAAVATIQAADDTGAWAEYYSNGKPVNTRYRPWESGINLEALLCFAEYAMKNH